MHYYTHHGNHDSNKHKPRPLNYKWIGLAVLISFIIYTNHNLIIFPNLTSEIWFDGFVISGFAVLLGSMLLMDIFNWNVIDNPEEVVLSHIEGDRALWMPSDKHKHARLHQLFDSIKNHIAPEIISAVINNFHWLDLHKHGVEQVKAYAKENNNISNLILLNQENSENLPNIKVNNQELLVSQKGRYKKVKFSPYDFNKIAKEEYLVVRHTYKVKKNSQGAVVKFDEKIAVKNMFGIVFNVK